MAPFTLCSEGTLCIPSQVPSIIWALYPKEDFRQGQRHDIEKKKRPGARPNIGPYLLNLAKR